MSYKLLDVTGKDALISVMHDKFGAENIDPSTLDPVSVARARGATIRRAISTGRIKK